LPGERDNAKNKARCTQARKATHGLDGQHQDMDSTLRGRVDDRGQGQMEKKKKKKIYSPKRLVVRKGFSPSTLATVNTNITCRNN